jgi:hypothetical protein
LQFSRLCPCGHVDRHLRRRVNREGRRFYPAEGNRGRLRQSGALDDHLHPDRTARWAEAGNDRQDFKVLAADSHPRGSGHGNDSGRPGGGRHCCHVGTGDYGKTRGAQGSGRISPLGRTRSSTYRGRSRAEVKRLAIARKWYFLELRASVRVDFAVQANFFKSRCGPSHVFPQKIVDAHVAIERL